MDLWLSGILAPPLSAATTKAWKKGWVGTACCSDTQPQVIQHIGITCELCNGGGWLICDFCRGEKTNVKSKSSRFYRRCPYCKAVGLVLCPKCRVFKCVTFPDISDGEA